MRRPHYLKANHNNESPQQAFWFDTETDPVPVAVGTIGHRLRFGWVAYSRRIPSGGWSTPEWMRFTEARAMWEWVTMRCRPKTCIYGFCHNTSFDLPVLDVFGELPKLGWKLTAAVIDAPPTILTLRRESSKMVLLDTLNLWRVPLKGLGQSIGLPKLEMPPADAPAAEWEAYARRDVEILLKACISWWDWLQQADLGGFAPTLASQALRTWRHRFMPAKVLCGGDDDLLAMEREAYHGGRVECFRLGTLKGRWRLLDVNSLYPYVMHGNQFPARIAFRRHTVGGFPWLDYARQYCCIAKVTVATDEPAYPYIADGKLIFPTGRFRATLCGPELIYASQRGHVAEVHGVAYYEGERLFDGFVEHLYTERMSAKQAGDATRAYYLKLMLNSLYGKFGQRGQVWREDDASADLSARSWVEVDAQTRVVTRFRQLGGLVQRLEREPESRDSVPAIAAYVTAYARIHLWLLIERAGRENVAYCDTDSLLVNDAGYERLADLLDDEALGGLKLECTTTRVILRGPKDYVIGDKVKIKGVRRTAEWLDDNTVRQERWRGLKGQLQDGDLTMPTTAIITKRLSRAYTKGTVDKRGRVHPLVLSE